MRTWWKLFWNFIWKEENDLYELCPDVDGVWKKKQLTNEILRIIETNNAYFEGQCIHFNNNKREKPYLSHMRSKRRQRKIARSDKTAYKSSFWCACGCMSGPRDFYSGNGTLDRPHSRNCSCHQHSPNRQERPRAPVKITHSSDRYLEQKTGCDN